MITITSRCSALPAGRQQLQQAGTTSAGRITCLSPFPLLGGQAANSSGAMPQSPAKVMGPGPAMGSPARSGPCFPQPLYSAGQLQGQVPLGVQQQQQRQLIIQQQYALQQQQQQQMLMQQQVCSMLGCIHISLQNGLWLISLEVPHGCEKLKHCSLDLIPNRFWADRCIICPV